MRQVLRAETKGARRLCRQIDRYECLRRGR